MPCSGGCTISVPAISQRVLYYKVIYRSASNNVLSATTNQVLLVPLNRNPGRAPDGELKFAAAR